MLKPHVGRCLCGAVRFEAENDLCLPTCRCNGPACGRNRFWPAIIAPEPFRPLAGEGELTVYRFNTRRSPLPFCRACGARPSGIGNDTPDGSAPPKKLDATPVISMAPTTAAGKRPR